MASPSGIRRFGSYIFPPTQEDFYTNFSNLVPSNTRLPGKDGSFRLNGDSRSPSESGSVTVAFLLKSLTREEMDGLRDALKVIGDWGLQKLVYQPTDPNSPERYCYAEVNNLPDSQNKDGHTDLWQVVRLNFTVPDPYWLVRASEDWLLGDDYILGDDLTLGDGGSTITASGTSTTDTINNPGSATSIAQVVVQPGTGDSCENVRVQRLVGGVVVDEISYTGVLVEGDHFAIDGAAQFARVNGSPAWDSVGYMHVDFFRLAPGDNTVRVLFENGGDAADVRIYFEPRYR